MLSMVHSGRVAHFVIRWSRDKGVFLEPGRGFPGGLDGLVRFHVDHAVGLPCRLQRACPTTGATPAATAEETLLPAASASTTDPVRVGAYAEYTPHRLSKTGSARSNGSGRSGGSVRSLESNWGPSGLSKTRKKAKIERKLAELPVFKPYMINLLTFIQMCVMLAFVAWGNLSTISFKPVYETVQVTMGLDNQSTVQRQVPTNMFIGPDMDFLIRHGAKYSPCMRKDTAVFVALARQRELEEEDFGWWLGPN